MSTGYIIALSILVISLVVLVVVGAIASKKVSPTLNNFNKLKEDVENTVNRYSKDGERLQNKVQVIQERVNLVKINTNQKFSNIEDLQVEINSLSDSLQFLKEHGAQLSKDDSGDLVQTIKEDGPKYLNILQGTVKRTLNKQKARYSS